MNEGNTATDADLVKLFDLDAVAELEAMAAGKGGKLFIATCDGQWAKYETQTTWLFQRDHDDPDIPDDE